MKSAEPPTHYSPEQRDLSEKQIYIEALKVIHTLHGLHLCDARIVLKTASDMLLNLHLVNINDSYFKERHEEFVKYATSHGSSF